MITILYLLFLHLSQTKDKNGILALPAGNGKTLINLGYK
jgi:replicative superfamily II helicase